MAWLALPLESKKIENLMDFSIWFNSMRLSERNLVKSQLKYIWYLDSFPKFFFYERLKNLHITEINNNLTTFGCVPK